MIALVTGARIVPRFQDLNAQCLGSAGLVEEMQLGTNTRDRMLVIMNTPKQQANSILIRGGSKSIVDEA